MLVFLFLSLSLETFKMFTLPVIHFKYSKPTRTYCIAQRTPLNIMWQPGWEGRMDTYLCIESLCCPLEILTTLISYILQYKMKSLIKKNVYLIYLGIWKFTCPCCLLWKEYFPLKLPLALDIAKLALCSTPGSHPWRLRKDRELWTPSPCLTCQTVGLKWRLGSD